MADQRANFRFCCGSFLHRTSFMSAWPGRSLPRHRVDEGLTLDGLQRAAAMGRLQKQQQYGIMGW